MQKFYLGNKFFGYLSAGLAVIANTGGECGKIIEQHSIGFSIKGSLAEDLVNSVIMYLQNPQVLAEHRLNARAAFLREFADTVVYQKYSAFLAEVVTSV